MDDSEDYQQVMVAIYKWTNSLNQKDFDKVVENRLDSCKRVLSSKDKEYSSDTDRLHNFRLAAAMSETTPELALWGMWCKHLVSVKDLIDRPENVTTELIHEKLGDVINYTLLLEGLLTERLPFVEDIDMGDEVETIYSCKHCGRAAIQNTLCMKCRNIA